MTPCWENFKIGQAQLNTSIGVGSTEFHVIRPSGHLCRRYLLHYLRQPSILVTGALRMTGSGGQRRVPAKYLQELAIPLPSLSEQRRIAAILDHADALRAKRRQVLTHLDALDRALFHHHFGLPNTWRDRWPVSTIGDLSQSVAYGTASKAHSTGTWPILRMGNITDDGRLDLR
ncbi:MAG: restriction endonuclease subunit S, partial [Cumulibacter sp.]